MQHLSYLAARLPCSPEDKTQCLQTMEMLSRFMTVARRKGFLALEPLNEKETDPLIKACLLDILDGLNGQALKQRFWGYLAAGDYRGKDFLQAVIVLRGFLFLQACQPPEVLWEKMQGLFGAAFAQEHREASGKRKGKRKCTSKSTGEPGKLAERSWKSARPGPECSLTRGPICRPLMGREPKTPWKLRGLLTENPGLTGC